MNLIGITGGIGMGKSTAAALLADLGVPVAETDDLARQIVEPGQPALLELAACFGPAILDTEGRLKRRELGRMVFADAEKRKNLEAILHPRIRSLWNAKVELWRQEGRRIGAVVIPLLFETKTVGCFDRIVCVACSGPTQIERLLVRGWSTQEIDHRCQAQLPASKKMEASDFVVWTEGSLETHREQLARILES